jgi:hypothetical protein
MTECRKFLQEMVRRMKVGEYLKVDGREFVRAFPCGWPSMYRTNTEAFLSAQIGSSWGCVRATQDPINGTVTISKHEEDTRRHYVDPDREHLFKKDVDGFWVPRRDAIEALAKDH